MTLQRQQRLMCAAGISLVVVIVAGTALQLKHQDERQAVCESLGGFYVEGKGLPPFCIDRKVIIPTPKP